MIIQDQTVEVKVWDHNDAVILVYEQIDEKTGEKNEKGHDIWRSYKKVFTAIPVDFSCGEVSEEERLEKVRKVASALAELYEHQEGWEMGVSYYMNEHQYVNC